MIKLMIVDDSNIIRSRIARILLHPLLKHMQIVGMAKNGVEAIDIAKRSKPNVITMDLTMPEMDGNACIEEIITLFPETNILVVSALSDKATAIDALTRGAKGFLYKPFTDEQLISALLEIISD